MGLVKILLKGADGKKVTVNVTNAGNLTDAQLAAQVRRMVPDIEQQTGTPLLVEAQPGDTISGIHYSQSEKRLRRLEGGRHGEGAKGAEKKRVDMLTPEQRQRTFYYPEGSRAQDKYATPRPEPGVGSGAAYKVSTPNMYDMRKNPLNISTRGNQMEADLREAGFRGVYDSEQGIAYNFDETTEAMRLGGSRSEAEMNLARSERLPDQPVNVTAEAIPSKDTEFGKWLSDQPLETRDKYTEGVENIYERERVMRDLGIEDYKITPGYGYYEGQLNPNSVISVPDAASAQAVADMRGLATQQDAVPYFQRTFMESGGEGPAGWNVQLPESITPEKMQQIYKDLGMEFTRTDLDSLDFINFLDQNGKPFSSMSDKEFGDALGNYFDRETTNTTEFNSVGQYNDTKRLWLPSQTDAAAGASARFGELRKRIEGYNTDFKKQNGSADPRALAMLGAVTAAGGMLATQDAEAGILRPAMGTVDRLVQLGMLKKPDSPRAVKSAQKRYSDNMKKSRAFAEREAKAAAGEFKTDFERADLGPRELISPESLQGSQLAAVRGDPSDIGTLRSNAGVQLPRDVNVEGGNRFSQRHAEDEYGWASAPEVATGAHSKLQQIAQNTGDDVVAVYNRMGDDSTNFSTPIAEAMHLEAMDNSKIAKKDKAAFDKVLRQSYPEWVGMDHPDALPQLMGTSGYPRIGKMRTAYAKLMGQDAFLKRGFPAYKPLIEGTQDVDLAGTQLGDAGLSIYRPDTSKPAAPFESHGTYEYQMPGSYMGGLGTSLPFEDVFPKSYAEQMGRVTKGDAPRPLPRAEQGFSREQAIDAINKRTDQYELADQEWVDNIMPKWEAARNAEQGSADPRLLAATAGLAGVAAYAGAPEAEAGMPRPAQAPMPAQAPLEPFNAANLQDIPITPKQQPQVTPETRRADQTNRDLEQMRVDNMRRYTEADRTFAGDMRGLATMGEMMGRALGGMSLGGLKAIWEMAGGAEYSDAVSEIDEMTAWAMEGFDPSTLEQLDMESVMQRTGENARRVLGDAPVDLYNTGAQQAGDAAFEYLDERGYPRAGAAAGAAIQGLEMFAF